MGAGLRSKFNTLTRPISDGMDDSSVLRKSHLLMTNTLSRQRSIDVGHLRTFEAVAQHLNFRAAADSLALTQSAVSRQIQSLEDDVGVALFLRHTRAVELTSAGTELLRTTKHCLQRLDATVMQIRRNNVRQNVSITTWASFASMWLIPRLETFQSQFPEIDIRVDANDNLVDLEFSDFDIAIRTGEKERIVSAYPHAQKLLDEHLVIVASPWLLKQVDPIKSGDDLRHLTLIDGYNLKHPNFRYLSWQNWFKQYGFESLSPKRWLYFNYAYQIAQAAIAGQGVALCRLPMVADNLRNGTLIEILPHQRLDSPMAYWLIVNSRSAQQPEVNAFCTWLKQQALLTQSLLPAPNTV